jgi:hypothetical protein
VNEEKPQMSICANVLMLFDKTPSAARIRQLEDVIANRLRVRDWQQLATTQDPHGRLVAVDCADLHADVNDDGSLKWDSDGRNSPRYGEPLLQGRLFCISYLTRYWSPGYPDGPLTDYAVTLLTLLSQSDIQSTWYVDDSFFEGGGTEPQQTPQSVHDMLDAYIRIGLRGNSQIY